MLEKPVKGIIGLQKYKTVIHWRNGVFISDEPEKLGGKDLDQTLSHFCCLLWSDVH